LQLLPRFGIGTIIITAIQVLSGGRAVMGEPTSLDGYMTCCMEAPGDRSVNMQDLVDEYRSLRGGCCPVVLRNGVEAVAFINPTFERTMVGREAADFLKIGSPMGPEGLIFEPTQMYLRATMTGRAQLFRVTPLHALGGPLIFGRDLLQAYRLTQGAGLWAIMTVVKILLDEVPDEIDSQGCDDLMVPLADIKRLCRMLDRRDPEAIELLLGKLCLDFPTVRLEEREMETLALVGEHVRAAGEEDYIFCLRALTNLAKRADFQGVQAELWQQLD
jgi:hypothetical protein